MNKNPEESLTEYLIFIVNAFLIVISAFYRSGRDPIALSIMELSGLFIITLLLSKKNLKDQVSFPVYIFIAVSLTSTALYLLPLPLSLWSTLPGRSLYTEVINWLHTNNYSQQKFYMLSIVPQKTILALLALLPSIGVFFSALVLSNHKVKLLIKILIRVASLQAVIGLIQYGSQNPVFYFFDISPTSHRAQGTYPNPDHFAALMEMALPLSLSLMFFTFRRQRFHHENTSHHQTFWSTPHRTLIFFGAALLIFLGGILANSRIGGFLILLAVLLSSFVFARHIGGRKNVAVSASFTTIAIGSAFSIGLIPIVNRYLTSDPFEDERWEIFKYTLSGFKTFFPLGSGPGTFSDIYRAFQPLEQLRFVVYAHNDYLELLFEMGLAGIFIIAGGIALYIYGWKKLSTAQNWGEMRFLQTASGISIFLILLHSFFDFNLHTPANAFYFAMLSGTFLRKN